MRKVNKDFNAPPDALQRGFEENKENLLQRKSEHQFDGRIYNGAAKPTLQTLYHDKCAYCESKISDDEFTVEHYRPKKGDYSYYWLGYEWSNLLPVCKKCNQAKNDKFPVAVPSRVAPNSGKKCRIKEPKLLPNGDLDLDAMKADHPYLLDEKPCLLHPEIDEPQEFFVVKRNGALTPKIEKELDEYLHKRADETIRLTNLNRDVLLVNRRKLIEQFEALLEKQTVRFLQEKAYQRDVPSSVRLAFFVVFDLIERQLEDEQEYTLTGRCIWSNIKEILFEAVHKENQEIEALLDYALSLYLQSKEVF